MGKVFHSSMLVASAYVFILMLPIDKSIERLYRSCGKWLLIEWKLLSVLFFSLKFCCIAIWYNCGFEYYADRFVSLVIFTKYLIQWSLVRHSMEVRQDRTGWIGWRVLVLLVNWCAVDVWTLFKLRLCVKTLLNYVNDHY